MQGRTRRSKRSATLGDVHWWGTYTDGGNPVSNGNPVTTDDFSIEIWSDGSGPDALLYDLTFGGAVGRVAAGTLGQFDVYAATQTGVIR